jgi:riboflavin kinase / FMN adenylyltransferase
MKVQVKSLSRFPVAHGTAEAGALKGAVLALGNFDGVHRGHREVISTAVSRARVLGRRAAALTFEPHPRTFFQPQTQLFRLTDETNKLRLFATTELDGAILMAFDASLANLTAEDFVTRILVDQLAIAGAAIGYNFFFGKERAGSPEFLTAQGSKYGFAVDIVPVFSDHGRPLSSQPIREALAAGHVRDANDMLGYPWFVTGEVVHGDKRGRELGFPTANLRLDPTCGLRHGVYAVRARIGGKSHDGVANFGRRPMFDVGTVLLEVFLFDFAGDLYGQRIDVAFIDYIRHELKFDSIEELIRRMDDDCSIARRMLAQTPDDFPPLDRTPG